VRAATWLGLSCLLVASLAAGIAGGSVPLPVGLVARALLRGIGLGDGPPPEVQTIVWELRLPRVLLAAVVGASLATSGAAYQALFRNDLADPYLLGVSAGAALGAVSAIAAGAGGLWVPVAAFTCALATVAIVFRIAHRAGTVRMEDLLLAGLALSALLGAGVSLLLGLGSGAIEEAMAWLVGGDGGRGWALVGQAGRLGA